MSLPLPAFSAHDVHPILVNFTAALVPASIGSDVIGKVLRKPPITDAAWWMLMCAAAITPFTAIAGWIWKKSVEEMLPANIITVHQWLGTSLALFFIILAAWRIAVHRKGKTPGFSYFTLAFVVLAALMYQGSLGGKMVFP